MQIFNILDTSSCNGPGSRSVIWTAGCTVGCPGCTNMHTWDKNSGQEMTVLEVFRKIEQNKAQHNIDGVTFSGGEPFEQFDDLFKLLTYIKTSSLDLDVLVFTGRNIDEIENYQILNYIDILVDGPFIQKMKTYDLLWRGSSNQRVFLLNKQIREKLNNKYNLLDEQGNLKDTETGGEFFIDENGETEMTGFGPFTNASLKKVL